MVVPHARRTAELNVQPVNAGFLIVRAMEPGNAQQPEPLRMPQKLINFERGIVDLLIAPRIRNFIVESVFDQYRSGSDPCDEQVAIDRQPVFTAREES